MQNHEQTDYTEVFTIDDTQPIPERFHGCQHCNPSGSGVRIIRKRLAS